MTEAERREEERKISREVGRRGGAWEVGRGAVPASQKEGGGGKAGRGEPLLTKHP